MSPRVLQWVSRFFFTVAVGLFALAGWFWYHDRPPVSALIVDAPVQLGAIQAAADHRIEVPVTNSSGVAIRLAGLDNEQC